MWIRILLMDFMFKLPACHCAIVTIYSYLSETVPKLPAFSRGLWELRLHLTW